MLSNLDRSIATWTAARDAARAQRDALLRAANHHRDPARRAELRVLAGGWDVAARTWHIRAERYRSGDHPHR